MDAWVTWLIQGAIALVFMLGAAYIRSIVNGLKDKIADNKKAIGENAADIEVNEKAITDDISAVKKEIYHHLEDQYYTKETMSAKIEALKYRQGSRPGGDPGGTFNPTP